MAYNESFRNIVDILLILCMVCIFFSLVLVHISGRRFRRSVNEKQRVDREDVIEFWRLGRIICILFAIAGGSAAPSGFESGAIELTVTSVIIWMTAFAVISGSVSLFAGWWYIFITRRTLKWRKKYQGMKLFRDRKKEE